MELPTPYSYQKGKSTRYGGTLPFMSGYTVQYYDIYYEGQKIAENYTEQGAKRTIGMLNGAYYSGYHQHELEQGLLPGEVAGKVGKLEPNSRTEYLFKHRLVNALSEVFETSIPQFDWRRFFKSCGVSVNE